MDLPEPFCPVTHMAPESFHLVFEGLTKLKIKRLFEDSNTIESGQVLDEWQFAIQDMFVFSETPRTTTEVKTGEMKGSEFGTIALSAFPALLTIMKGRRRQHW